MRRKAITSLLPRVDIKVLPPEVQREGLDAFKRIGVPHARQNPRSAQSDDG
jgi:hypothetical protein